MLTVPHHISGIPTEYPDSGGIVTRRKVSLKCPDNSEIPDGFQVFSCKNACYCLLWRCCVRCCCCCCCLLLGFCAKLNKTLVCKDPTVNSKHYIKNTTLCHHITVILQLVWILLLLQLLFVSALQSHVWYGKIASYARTVKFPGVIFLKTDSFLPSMHSIVHKHVNRKSVRGQEQHTNIKSCRCIACTFSKTQGLTGILSFNNRLACRSISWCRITPLFAKLSVFCGGGG